MAKGDDYLEKIKFNSWYSPSALNLLLNKAHYNHLKKIHLPNSFEKILWKRQPKYVEVCSVKWLLALSCILSALLSNSFYYA